MSLATKIYVASPVYVSWPFIVACSWSLEKGKFQVDAFSFFMRMTEAMNRRPDPTRQPWDVLWQRADAVLSLITQLPSTAAHTRPQFCDLPYRFPADALARTDSILTHHSQYQHFVTLARSLSEFTFFTARKFYLRCCLDHCHPGIAGQRPFVSRQSSRQPVAYGLSTCSQPSPNDML